MQVTYATAATPGQGNEDYVVAGPEWALVLDGATNRADVDSGSSVNCTAAKYSNDGHAGPSWASAPRGAQESVVA